MATVGYTISVRATFDVLWSVLRERVEHPDRTNDRVTDVRVETRADGSLHRTMQSEAGAVVETITLDESFRRVKATLVDHPVFSGWTQQEVAHKRHGDGTLDLTVSVNWTYRDGREVGDLGAVVQATALDIKTAAEAMDESFVVSPDTKKALFVSPEADFEQFGINMDDALVEDEEVG